METIQRTDDVKIMCVKAKTFPEGIKEAFDTLHSKFPNSDNRVYYGISYMGEGDKIIYKAAIQELNDGEAQDLGLEEFTIVKGEYISKRISNFMDNIPEIGNTFTEMFKDERIDRENGVCVEEYSGNDVICSIKLK